jgi:hypothetical protein
MSFRRNTWLAVVLFAVPVGAVSASQTTTYIFSDAQGSVIARADMQGAIIDRAAYRPFGERAAGVAQDGPGFVGGYEDAIPGFVSVGGRLLDTATSRYLLPVTADNVADTHGNPYGFGRANPLRPDQNVGLRGVDFIEPAAR